jgi:release factor glutamine methyltransferase
MTNAALHYTMVSAADALRDAVMMLQRAHIVSASLDARLLLQHVLNVSREQLLEGTNTLTPEQESHYRELIGKRLQRQPVAQLTGRREFWGLTFKVTASTLDPRPDSETLIEAVLARFRDHDRPLRILDMGTGSGCLLLSLLSEYAQAHGCGVDRCDRALEVAKENAARLGMQARATFVQSSWGDKVSGPFDIIISNPPYIPTAAIALLEPEVRQFEPRQALDGGKDGMDCYRAIMPQLPGLLADGGLAVFEIGMGQQHDLQAIASENGLQVAGIKDDLAGIPRCVFVQKNSLTLG